MPNLQQIQDGSVTPEYQRYVEIRSEHIDNLLTIIYNKKYSELTKPRRKIISVHFPNFKEVLSKNIYNQLFTSSTIKNKILSEQLFDFKYTFLYEAADWLQMTTDEYRWREFFVDKKYLNSEDCNFIRKFYNQENHLPYIFIIYKALIFHPIENVKTTPHEIFASFIGLKGSRKSLVDIGAENHLTRTRIQQIISNFKNTDFIAGLTFKREEILNIYSFLDEDFLTENNTNFLELCAKEHLSFDFHAFCQICSLINTHIEPISFYTNKNGQFISENCRCECIYTSAYTKQLNKFNFSLLLQKIQDIVNKENLEDIILFEFVKDTSFWSDNVQLDLVQRVVRFAEYLTKNLLQLQCIDGIIHIESKKKNVQKALCDCLLEANKPLSLKELFDSFQKKCSDTKYTTIEQLKRLLSRTNEIVSIGGKALYVLAEQEDLYKTFKGSLYESIEYVLRKNSSPIKRNDLVTPVLELRSDSNHKSIQAVISTMLNTKRLVLFNKVYVGLQGIEYENTYQVTPYESHLTFEERLQQMRDFVEKNNRLPFTSGGTSLETSLALWYARSSQKIDLTTEQLVELYNFQKEINASHIPQTAGQYVFLQNCIEYKNIIMRTGVLVTYSQNERLYRWLSKYCSHYTTLTDVRKIYFDDFISYVSAFGFELKLQ